MNSKNNIKRADGFSLIELLITVAIIGIIAAVALPSYSEYMMKSRRVDGIAFLTEVASDQVRFYSEYNRYGSSMTELGYGAAATADSKEGFYRVSVTTPASGASYLLTATPLGSQLKDAECATLTLNSSGVKTESGTAASARDCF